MMKVVQNLLAFGLAGLMLLGSTACAADEGVLLATTANTSQQSGSTAASATILNGKIISSGSTSMEELMSALGEAFSVIHPQVAVEIQGGGSSTGVKNVSAGVSEIGNASRTLKDEEKALGLTEHIIAIDGLAVVVNPDNPLANLSKDQLVAIFTGQTVNWRDVGGADAPIWVVIREAGSGTRDGFEDLLKIKDLCKESQVVNETGVVKSTIAGNINAIGYMSLGKVDGSIRAVPVDGVMPTEESVINKSYPLQRPFLCLTKGEESGLVKAFFSFVFSTEGQTMVTRKGYVPVQ